MRKTLAFTLIAASLMAGGSAFAGQPASESFSVMNPATPDPEVVMDTPLNGALPQDGQFGSGYAQHRTQSHSAHRIAPEVTDHVWGQENAMSGA